MSTVVSPSPATLGLNVAAPGQPTSERRSNGARALAALLLAAAVAALVVVADRLIDTWADGHLFLAWVALWAVIFAGSVLFAGSATRLARRTLRSLDSWSASLAEARAEVRLWELAKHDARLKAEFIEARSRAATAPAQAVDGSHDFSEALAPMGMEPGYASPADLRRLAQSRAGRPAGFLPYL